jgi:glyoxylase-like metal-dependent hydrolase (beta-lactamase superfamily II)
MQDLENNPEVIRNDYSMIDPIVPKDATDILLAGPVSPTSITAVIFSHLHFDHTGNCTKFPDAEIIVGPGSFDATSPGWPAAQLSPFSSAVINHPHFHELSFEKETWVPYGPFSRACTLLLSQLLPVIV